MVFELLDYPEDIKYACSECEERYDSFQDALICEKRCKMKKIGKGREYLKIQKVK